MATTLSRQAPPVRVRGQGGALWRRGGMALPAMTVASVAAWAALHLGLSGVWALVLAGALAALTAALLARRRPAAHELAWDGRRWQVDGRPHRLQLMLDLGPWMLLRARPDAPGAALWLPLSAREAGPAWGPLRAAVYARPAPAAPLAPAPEHRPR